MEMFISPSAERWGDLALQGGRAAAAPHAQRGSKKIFFGKVHRKIRLLLEIPKICMKSMLARLWFELSWKNRGFMFFL